MKQAAADFHLIQGARHIDERGIISFVNDFNLRDVGRCYWITSDRANLPRGWVGHQREHKWFTAVSGEALLAVVKLDDWQNPNRNLPVTRRILSADNPRVLHVPPGHATGSIGRNAGAVLMVFSSGKIETAKEDSYRFPPDYWPMEGDAEEPR
jgi:dTDP-4-dehydrorhamnose 3,5-epimerase-like enzyme